MKGRIHNFNAGPAAHPLSVLKEIQAAFLNFKDSGMSIMEVSHRSRWFEEVIQDAKERVRRLLELDENFHVVFIQGGASLQFCMVPMNLLPDGQSADYVNTAVGRLCKHRHLGNKGNKRMHDSRKAGKDRRLI
jgi:phosphoserine aminotransferase